MLHEDRTWRVVDEPDAARLAKQLTDMTWTGCTGFRRRGLLYLNDSASGDVAQEYAVVRQDDGRQLESVTFGWMTRAQALDWISCASPEMVPQFRFLLGRGALAHPSGSCCLCA